MTIEQIIAALERISTACSQDLSASGMGMAEQLKARLRESKRADDAFFSAIRDVRSALSYGVMGLYTPMPMPPQTMIGANP